MQSAEELKTSESQYSVLMPDDVASAAVCCYAAANGASAPLPPLLYNSPPNNRFGDTNKTNLNGSIITLTMKNNHLIVETEERVPGVCMASASEVAAATAAAAAAAEAAAKSMDYEYDDDEFDMEAEMLRREFREASLLANGDGGPATINPAVLEPSSQTQVDLTVDRRPTASVAVQPPPHQLQPVAADHSSGGSSSVDSRVAEMAYAYGNQSEYTAEDVPSKHCGKAFAVVKSAAVASSVTAVTVNNSYNNNNNDDEYLVEQRLLGNGADGGGGGCTGNGNSAESPPPNTDNCSPEDCGLASAAATATVSQ
ncbi:uncharacterized protein LOC103307633 [Acyrthosiphon pisum]|uniref:Uncharacterized protein n=1 Tax=Acyrthosiphon pisum TaxID=7029 RepID=A0A8R1WZ88_ACYPI|nr:uncharacterized protein LOC103307633 [Acyrthosiphon pisum]|eukprot:XP_008180577.1 PREDICTED: uncharacterized protein LOC103307633 [Acyrthosiphon pisum]